MEDDDPLRRSLERLMASWAIPTITARTVREARLMLTARPDLVITDVRLPDGNGQMVAEAASALSPAPLVAAMSGVASAAEAFDLAMAGVQIYLGKPFSASQLSAKIEEALQATTNEGGRVDRVPLAASVHEFALRYQLTPRQIKLVQLAVTGHTRREYPEILGVTENTTKTMIRRLLHKIGARSLADIPRMMLVYRQDIDA